MGHQRPLAAVLMDGVLAQPVCSFALSVAHFLISAPSAGHLQVPPMRDLADDFAEADSDGSEG